MMTDVHDPWDPNDQSSPGKEIWLSFKRPSIAALAMVLQQGRIA